jgi:23S rRNA pseudouridine1911/1915/1917 synthase
MGNHERSKRTFRRKAEANQILTVTEKDELMKFLIAQLPGKNRNNIKSLLANKQVIVDGQAVRQFNHPLIPGQQVEVRWNRVPEEKQYRGITIVYEDADIIVIDKHSGVLSIATPGQKSNTAYSMLSSHVKSRGSGNKIFVVHRLDRETSGLMMFAKSEKVQRILQSNWHEMVSERTYVAVVEGIPHKKKGDIMSYLYESKALKVHSTQDPEAGDKATTHYEVLRSGRGYSLLKVDLESGKKNQVRVHMQDIGHPVAGDKKYGARSNPIGRLALHARVLAFSHPVSGKPMRFETPVPRKFSRLF